MTALFWYAIGAIYADLPPAVGEQAAATARALSLGDGSLAAAGLRGLTMSHSDWIHASGTRSGLRTRWRALFREVDVVLCPPIRPSPFRTSTRRNSPAFSTLMAPGCPISIRPCGPASPR
jgi:hypothetical protein